MTDNITDDHGITALRAIRCATGDIHDHLATASSSIIYHRNTIQAQEVRIGELEAEVTHLKRLHTDATEQGHDSLDEVDQLKAANRRMMTVIHQANDEMREMREVNKSMHDRLTEHANDRYGRETEPSILEAALSAAEHGPSWLTNRLPPLMEACDKHADNRMANVTRLANAAIRHLEANRPAIAIQLLKPLAGGQHDTYDYQENTKDSDGPRSNDDAEDIRGFGPFGWEDGQT